MIVACEANTFYQKILNRHGLTPSMSRKGNCPNNALMESFFGSMKNELVHRTRFATREDAKRALFWWIESDDNRRRPHSALGNRTPAQAFEMMAKAA
ncbi:MAG: integrase core domain-containing protein [Geminicoccaceae bacterium]